jgi:predicted nucleic acid-binding protein
MILDTNALSAAAEQDPAVLAVLSGAEQLALPVIVLGEYRYGIAQSRYRAIHELVGFASSRLLGAEHK